MSTEPHAPLRPRRVRALLGIALVSAVAAIVAATAAFSGRSPRPVEQVTPAVAARPPVTIPVAMPATTTPSPPPPSTASPASTVAPLSPLAAQLGPRDSARLRPPGPELPLPVALRIESIGVDADPVVPVGVDAKGQVEVPKASEVGWYRFGPRPGEAGATVLAAHVSWVDEAGVFALLSRIEVGARVEVTLADGAVRTYEVVERAQYGKDQLPPERIWSRSGPETLVLITCGGEFNPQLNRYRDNIVAYAVPVAASDAPVAAS
jgi:LPXTG-site transpeptidase (sortase) family protein